MRRRDFITLVGGAALASPLAARAQERVRRIGVLMAYTESDSEAQVRVAAFREGLQKLGWAEGRNIRIEYRWAPPGDAESRQQFAKDLVALQPELIFTDSTPNTAALLQQTRTIPIIFAVVPIRSAAALSRAFHARAATSPVSLFSSPRWAASGWNCSRRLRRASTG
jgi:putative ABC transport system substrate-binding protein